MQQNGHLLGLTYIVVPTGVVTTSILADLSRR